MPEPEFLTTTEVAELLRVPADTIRYWRVQGKGPRSFRVGRHRLYDRNDINAWVAAQKAA